MGHKILLADDSITVQKIVKLTFTDEGIEVVATGNGEMALQELMDWQPDLVLADVFMPGRDGYEVCQYIKTHPDLCHIPVVLLVHAFEPFDQARADEVKADCNLTKPFHSIRTLVTTVKGLIEKSTQAAATLSDGKASLAATAASAPAAGQGIEAEPASYDTAPLKMHSSEAFHTSSDSGSGAVMELKPQAESDSRLSVMAFQADNEQAASVTPVRSTPMEAVPVESGELLSVSNFGNLDFGFPAPATPAETVQETEEVSLLAVLDSGNASAEQTAVTGPEVISTTVPVQGQAVSAAGDEILELEEILPGMPLGQVGEMDFLVDTMPLSATPEKTVSNANPLEQEGPEENFFTDEESRIDAPPVLALFEADTDRASVPVTEPVLPMQFVADEMLNTQGQAKEITEDYELADLLQPRDHDFGQAVGTKDTDNFLSDKQQIPAIAEGRDMDLSPAAEVRLSESQDSLHLANQISSDRNDKQDLGTGFVTSAPASPDSAPLTEQSVSPALIDEIVSRVVARLSEKAIQEIAWEVVPEMAELLIRRQLAEKSH